MSTATAIVSSLPTELVEEDYANLQAALDMAKLSLSTGGIPIGAVLSVLRLPSFWLSPPGQTGRRALRLAQGGPWSTPSCWLEAGRSSPA